MTAVTSPNAFAQGEAGARTRLKRDARKRRGIVFLFVVCYTAIVVKNLWIADDAYITFRTVDNFLHGYGLTWNTDERVQSFTHPLWLLLLSAANVTIPNMYFAALALAIACSLIAVAVFAFGIAGSRVMAVLGLVALATSKSFVDFSTSGLENPLTHLLLTLFALVYLRHEQDPSTFVSFAGTRWESRLRAVFIGVGEHLPWVRRLESEDRYLLLLGTLAGLAALNRMDTLLLYLPAMAHVAFQRRSWRGAGLMSLGFVPLALWEVFSLWYYGFLFPNTAYAKLSTGVSMLDYLTNGVHYLWDSAVYFDPILLFIPLGLFIPLFFKGRRCVPLALGSLLYMAYVVKIGGDFMAGRFLTASLLLSLILLSRMPVPKLVSSAGVALGLTFAVCLVAGFEVTNGTVYALHLRTGEIRYYHVIGDERSVWGFATSIDNIGRNPIPHVQEAEWGRQARAHGKKFVVGSAIGYLGYEAGPHVHVEDLYALNDPLLARLPTQPGWRIGHFSRAMPSGYLETVESGVNAIQDPGLRAYYDKLHLITSGSLFDFRRLIVIFRMNTGQYEYLLRSYEHKLPTPKRSGAIPNVDGDFMFVSRREVM